MSKFIRVETEDGDEVVLNLDAVQAVNIRTGLVYFNFGYFSLAEESIKIVIHNLNYRNLLREG